MYTSAGDQAQLQYMFNGAYASTLYFGLSTNAINMDGTGITEPSGNGYARVAVTASAANFPVTTIANGSGGGAQVANANAITWPTSTGSGWGTVTNWFVSTAATGGTIIAQDVFKDNNGNTITETIGYNNTFSFPANAWTHKNV